MTKVIEDLFVKVQTERIRLRDAKRHPPEDINALTKGVLTGLNLGLNTMEGRYVGDGELLLAYLAGGSHIPLSEKLKTANSLMPEDKPFTHTMFVGLHYRTSESHLFYEKGIREGFHYVEKLFNVFCNPSSLVVARRMTMDHVKNVVKMLEHL